LLTPFEAFGINISTSEKKLGYQLWVGEFQPHVVEFKCLLEVFTGGGRTE